MLFKVALNVFRALLNAYGFSVTAFLLLRLLIGESWHVIAFFNTFAHVLWIPALIALPLALLTRSWVGALLTIAPVLAFIVAFGARFLPQDAPMLPVDFRVLSYNLLGDGRSYEASIALIKEANADIVVLQEFNVDAEPLVIASLIDLYPYQKLHAQRNSTTQGQAILSKTPILQDEYWQYRDLGVFLGHQRAVITIKGKRLVLYNVHPTHPGMGGNFFDPSVRSIEIARLMAKISQETLPVLLMGDFNMPELSDDYALITQTLQDSYASVGRGMGWTFPHVRGNAFVFPFLRLDYVFHDASFAPLEAHVWRTSGGSDHFPLFVSFAWHN